MNQRGTAHKLGTTKKTTHNEITENFPHDAIAIGNGCNEIVGIFPQLMHAQHNSHNLAMAAMKSTAPHNASSKPQNDHMILAHTLT
jgi:hypothetical protein